MFFVVVSLHLLLAQLPSIQAWMDSLEFAESAM